MLEKLGVIQSSKSEETKQFIEEYGIFEEDEENTVIPILDNNKQDSSNNQASQIEKDEEKVAKEMREAEKKKELQKKKLETTYFRIEEIKRDFEEFIKNHFSMID